MFFSRVWRLNWLSLSSLVAVTVTLVYRMFSGSNLNLRYAFTPPSLLPLGNRQTAFCLHIFHFSAYSKFYGSLEILTVFSSGYFIRRSSSLFSAAIARTAYRLFQREAESPERIPIRLIFISFFIKTVLDLLP
jgi:hypothetical protein